MTDLNTAPILVLAGPTASGKSALGIALARQFNGTVINADSMQVYRDLRVLTARPDDAEMAQAPHRLYGVLDGAEHGTAARWVEMARGAIAETLADGRLPILLGGTGMYLRSLFEGLADIPAIPEAARAEARIRLETEGPEALHAALAAADPETAARLRPGDSQRLVRAWEVLQATGKGLAAWQAEAPGTAPLSNPVFRILLQPSRDSLYARINRRFEVMMEQGALAEAEAVRARCDIPPDAPMRKAHGLPELIQYLDGQISRAEAIRVGQLNTRHYAKRQTTWFRHQFKAELVVEKDLSRQENFNSGAEIFPLIVRYLLTVR